MGTRGALGFYKDGTEKVAYNHYDSYPSGLGSDTLKFCKDTTIKEMEETFNKIVLVDEQSEPTNEQIKECKEYYDSSVSSKSEKDWYCLLRHAQGTLEPYKNGLKYMIDSKEFLTNSLFCEYAYIINLDTEMLEFYIGFNKDPKANGRYADKATDNQGYCGVALKKEFPLESITTMSIENILDEMKEQDKDEN